MTLLYEFRRKVVPISMHMFHTLFMQGNVIHAECIQGLPSDARFIGMAYEPLRNVYVLCFESEQWEPVPEGKTLPQLDVIYRSIEIPS